MNKLSAVQTARIQTIASAVLSVATSGEGFYEITRDVARFLTESKARDGAVLVYLKHTSASLVIQENADADVRTRSCHRAQAAGAGAGRLGARRGGAGRYAGPYQIHAQRRVLAGAR
jgi:hypothetical protein